MSYFPDFLGNYNSTYRPTDLPTEEHDGSKGSKISNKAVTTPRVARICG